MTGAGGHRPTPTGPSEPTRTTAPGPSEPTGTTASSGPTEPTEPTGSSGAAGPAGPTDATAPAGPTDPADRDELLVWYVAYGSNMAQERLRTYLAGDRHLGPASTHDGARDRRPPLADAPHALSLEVFFAGRSTRWEGAVAYCDHACPAPGPVLGRRWLLRRSQLEDLVRQENRHPGPVTADLATCRHHGHLDVAPGRYGRLLWLGEVDGIPAVTATCARPTTPEGPAGVAYLRTIARGLAQSWGLDHVEAARYLAARRGNAGRLDPAALADLLARTDG